MKELFLDIKKSVYDPVYYQELLSRPAKYSIKYFFGLALLAALILSIALSFSIVPLVRHFVSELSPNLLGAYPEELVVTVANGTFSANVPQPYYIDPPHGYASELAKNGFAHLVVIDTLSDVTPDRFSAYATLVWFAARHVVVADTNGQMKINEYEPGTDFILDKAKFATLVHAAEPYFKWAAPVVVAAVFVGMSIAQMFNLLYLVFGAVLIFLLGRFALKQKWTYGASYRIGLHALTLPILLDTALALFGRSLSVLPFFATAIMLAVVYVNGKEAKPVIPEQEKLPLDAPPAMSDDALGEKK